MDESWTDGVCSLLQSDMSIETAFKYWNKLQFVHDENEPEIPGLDDSGFLPMFCARSEDYQV